jgi:hypothetical protein
VHSEVLGSREDEDAILLDKQKEREYRRYLAPPPLSNNYIPRQKKRKEAYLKPYRYPRAEANGTLILTRFRADGAINALNDGRQGINL